MIIFLYDYRDKFEKLRNEIREHVKVGMWASYCCDRDLFEITTQEQANDVAEATISDIEDNLGTYTLFSTKDEALAFFRRCGLDC